LDAARLVGREGLREHFHGLVSGSCESPADCKKVRKPTDRFRLTGVLEPAPTYSPRPGATAARAGSSDPAHLLFGVPDPDDNARAAHRVLGAVCSLVERLRDRLETLKASTARLKTADAPSALVVTRFPALMQTARGASVKFISSDYYNSHRSRDSQATH
jgi:hypothetical protein